MTIRFPFYVEQLEMILAVTKMLNENGNKIPTDENYYFKVQLVEAHTEEVIGEWSDEIGPDCWEFSLADEKPKFAKGGVISGAYSIQEDREVFDAAEKAEIERIREYSANNKSVQLD